MTVIMKTDLYCALTAPSITHIPSLTKIFFVNVVTNKVFSLSLNSNRLGNIEYIGHLAV